MIVEGTITANQLLALLLIVIDIAIYAWLQHTGGKAAHYYWQEVGVYVFMFAVALAGITLPVSLQPTG